LGAGGGSDRRWHSWGAGCGDVAWDGRSRARERTRRDGAGALGAHGPDGSDRADPLLELRRALGRAAGPLAQALELAGLGERQQRQHRDADQRDEGRYRADLGERVRQREGEQSGCHACDARFMRPESV
jgi:hypothetical protein